MRTLALKKVGSQHAEYEISKRAVGQEGDKGGGNPPPWGRWFGRKEERKVDSKIPICEQLFEKHMN